MLECIGITKSFHEGQQFQEVLRGVDLTLRPGETSVLLGPSGSGKTTLLSILGCLLTPTSGEVTIQGRRVDYADRSQMIRLRRTQIGFVFQQGQLLSFLTMEENLRCVGLNSGLQSEQVRSRTDELLSRLGVTHLRGKKPRQTSRGEQQRIAVARALIHHPAIILADEPTAALDWENGRLVIQLLTQLAEDEEKVLLTVTHDARLATMFRRRFYIERGRVQER